MDLQGIGGRAAFTIVSKNYLASARVLAKSYLAHHPGHRFFVVLVDELGDGYEGEGEGFELVLLRDVPIPNPDVFPYQYTILELNTAVKPFCHAWLLERHGFEGLLYIDPDIMVFRHFDEVWGALEHHDIVLTPHMRVAFGDNASPSELSILQSGTYNLGFLGLRRGETASRMLQWWAERLYSDCVVDIPRGLFVDQKWMDLVPAYFDGVKILRDPTYNVAYWNLHERLVTQAGDGFEVDGRPLAFFHYSGYAPTRPDRLSKHQTRHSLATLGGVRAICDLYADELEAAGYSRTTRLPYAYGRLGNGVKVTGATNALVLHCVRRRIAFPSPRLDAEGFCRFLMTPNPRVFGANVAPLISIILDMRPDVAAAFPNARWDKSDKGMLDWLQGTGAAEEQMEVLVRDYGHLLSEDNLVARAMLPYDSRKDLQEAFPKMFSSSEAYLAYKEWMTAFGREEEGITDEVISSFGEAEAGFRKVLSAYFSRIDLLGAFPLLYQDSTINRLANWFVNSLGQFGDITLGDVQVFERVAMARKDDFLLASLRYNPHAREAIGGIPSALNLGKIKTFLSAHGCETLWPVVVEHLLDGKWISPAAQYHAFCQTSHAIRQLFPDRLASQVDAIKCAQYVLDRYGFSTRHTSWSRWSEQVLASCKTGPAPGINVFGYLRATTGVGESGRSMVRVVRETGLAHTASALPSIYEGAVGEAGLDMDLFDLYGGHDPGLAANVVLVNADMFPACRDWLPVDTWDAQINIGYWHWETEALPAKLAASASGLQAIWTSSHYSARAIRQVVDLPVQVVPISLDFDAIGRAQSNRAAFGLPENVTLYGYFFDSKSEFERKNPAGLIRAFRRAFGDRMDVALVLKVNSPAPGYFEFEQLKLLATGLNVIWIEEVLDRERTFDLMASLDVYVSLHRSEGFGLTMAEAMALGKPVVATAYSGNMDFMDEDVALLVDFDVIGTARPFGPYPTGTRWAQPCEEDAASKMATLADAELRRTLGERGRKHIEGKLKPSTISTDVLLALSCLTKQAPTSTGSEMLIAVS